MLAVLGITAVGCALRAYRLDMTGIWLDEAFSWMNASGSLGTVFAPRWDVSPPLFNLLLHFWIDAFGDGEPALRSLSVLLGTAAIPLTAALGVELFDRRTGLLASAFMAVMVFPVHYSREARPYGLFLVATLCSFLFFVKSLRADRGKDWAGYVLATAAVCYSHNYWVFVLLAQTLYAIVFLAGDRRRLVRVLAAQAGAVLCFAPWMVEFLRTSTRLMSQGLWIPTPTVGSLTHTARSYVAFLLRPAFAYLLLLLCLAGALAPTDARLPASGRPARERLRALASAVLASDAFRPVSLLAAWLVVPVLVPFLVSRVFTPIYLPRYTIAVLPACYLLLARGVWRVPTVAARAVVLSLVGASCMTSLHHYYRYTSGERTGVEGAYVHFPLEGWRELADYVSPRVDAADGVAVAPRYASPPLEYYLGKQRELYALPTSLETGTPGGVDAALEAATAGRGRLWLFRREGGSGAGRSITDLLDERYRRLPFDGGLQSLSRGAITLYLYDLSGPESSSEGR